VISGGHKNPLFIIFICVPPSLLSYLFSSIK